MSDAAGGAQEASAAEVAPASTLALEIKPEAAAVAGTDRLLISFKAPGARLS